MPVTLFLSPSTLLRSEEYVLGMLPQAKTYCDSSTVHYLLRCMRVHIPLGSFDLSETIGLARGVLERARDDAEKLLVVGGTASDAARFREHLTAEFRIDESNIVSAHGYHRDILTVVLRLITEHRPDVVILGLGAPMQEYVASHCARQLPGADIYTCGGFISQTALAGGRFYPPFFDRTHTRWLYRIFRQPYVLKRLFIEYVRGFWAALRLGRRLCGSNCRPPP